MNRVISKNTYQRLCSGKSNKEQNHMWHMQKNMFKYYNLKLCINHKNIKKILIKVFLICY